MTYDDQLEERRREFNKEVERRQYLRQDAEWSQKQLDADRAQARRYFNKGDMYLGIYQMAGPAAANAYAAQMRANQEFVANAVNDYYNKAITEMRNSNYTDAIKHFTNAIRLNQSDGILPYGRGYCHYELGDYTEAERDYSKAIALNPQFCFARLQRGICRVFLRDFDGAINDLDAAQGLLQYEQWSAITTTSQDAELAKINYWRGSARYWKDDLVNAISDLSNAIQYQPDWTDPYSLRASAYSTMQAPSLAIADLTSVLKRKPTASAFRDRAFLYRQIGNHAAALNDLDEVIRRDPTAPDYTSRGWWRLNSGILDDNTLLDFQTAIRLGDESTFAYLGRAHLHRERGEIAEAIEDYTAVIRLDSDHGGATATALRERAYLHEEIGDNPAALDDLEEAIRVNLNDKKATAAAYRQRAYLYRKIGNDTAALNDLDEVIRLNPTANDFTSRGWWRLHSGSLDDALLDIQTAIRLGDESAFAYLGRAHLHREKGEIAEAIEDYSTAIRLDPDDVNAYANRARLHFDRGEHQAALADFDQSIRLDPSKALYYEERGSCHLKLGNRAAAKKDRMTAANLYFEQDMPEWGKKAYTRALTT